LQAKFSSPPCGEGGAQRRVGRHALVERTGKKGVWLRPAGQVFLPAVRGGWRAAPGGETRAGGEDWDEGVLLRPAGQVFLPAVRGGRRAAPGGEVRVGNYDCAE